MCEHWQQLWRRFSKTLPKPIDIVLLQQNSLAWPLLGHKHYLRPPQTEMTYVPILPPEASPFHQEGGFLMEALFEKSLAMGLATSSMPDLVKMCSINKPLLIWSSDSEKEVLNLVLAHLLAYHFIMNEWRKRTISEQMQKKTLRVHPTPTRSTKTSFYHIHAEATAFTFC